jgi:hypothetical protein
MLSLMNRYHIPVNVQEHVDYITPGLRLLAGGRASPGVPKRKSSQKRAATPGGGIIPIIGKVGNIDPRLMFLSLVMSSLGHREYPERIESVPAA